MKRILSAVLIVIFSATALFLVLMQRAPKADAVKVPTSTASSSTHATTPVVSNSDSDATPVYGYKIIHTYPHDRDAFTQGLIFDEGFLYEGTGIWGQSSLRKVSLEKGDVLKISHLPSEYFGEGITLWKEELIQLTWQSHVGFVYDKESFRQLRQFDYPWEGWGITHDGKRLIMSDGTPTLHFLDPETFREIGRIEVHDKDMPITHLNELEYIQGEVYANVWLTDRIARISPETGQVIAWIDLTGLLSASDRTPTTDVLNGIAYDAKGDRLFVTGKNWPKLFEIQLTGPQK